MGRCNTCRYKKLINNWYYCIWYGRRLNLKELIICPNYKSNNYEEDDKDC